MKGLLIFDHLNDIIYTKFDEDFKKHIQTTAENLGLIPEEEKENTDTISNNVIVQMFSPIVTSHRIMSCQFGNSYTSTSLQNNLKVQFNEYMGYLFLGISGENQQYSKKFLSICVAIVRYLCGPDVYQSSAYSKYSECKKQSPISLKKRETGTQTDRAPLNVFGCKPKAPLAVHDTAITLCAQDLSQGYNKRSMLIFTDSQAANKALDSYEFKSELVWECGETITRLARTNKVTLSWVSSYSDVTGNDKAEGEILVYTWKELSGIAWKLLHADEPKCALASKLIDNWSEMVQNDQSILIEAVEQLVINTDLSTATIKALKKAIEMLAPNVESSRIHALILVQNKFLSLYSSPNAKELSSADILFCSLLSHKSTSETIQTSEVLTDISSYQVLLYGPEQLPKCLPHVIHIIPISESVNLIFLLQLGNPQIAASLYETFCHLHTIQMVQIQRDKDTLQLAFENLDLAIRRLNDSLKKNKVLTIETSHKKLMKKWEMIKKKYQDFLKTSSDEALLRAETLALSFLENLKDLLKFTSIDDTILNASAKYVLDVAQSVRKDLDGFHEFFRAKSIKNFSLGSDSLTITKYLEEFPGLVHFLYVDRNTHRVTTPTLDGDGSEKSEFIKKKVWFMVHFTRKHLLEGHTTLMWKDTAFHYTYFLWFEDNTGAPLKPHTFPALSTPLAGIICEDYYRKLKDTCFPKMSSAKIRCYELFCVHLGLVTASCVLEQSRRLAATVWELKGVSSKAIEFL